MVFGRRICCHFCGDKSPYTKSSRVSEFQCEGCEAFNFLDSKGDIIDTPASVVAQADGTTRDLSPNISFARSEAPDQQGSTVTFCKTCEHNQRIYLETLSNYLPDEDHPEYQKYEDALPQFKADLQQRYPQICRKCAPAAQIAISRADYNARTHDIGKLCNDTIARRGTSRVGSRDDWSKWSMRIMLNTTGLVLLACLLIQAAWHARSAYNLFWVSESAVNETMAADEVVDTILGSHLPQYQPLFPLAGRNSRSRLVSYSLVASVCLLWYNPGIKAWYHPTYRMECVRGQTEYFFLQLILLAARTSAWYFIPDPVAGSGFSKNKTVAAHLFMIVLIVVVNRISQGVINPVIWRYRFKLTPKPDEKDVFNAPAGLVDGDFSPPQASSVPPYQLFARDHDTPFPIANLAPRQRRGKAMSIVSLSDGPPSPPKTDSDDGEAMEIDWVASGTRHGLSTRSAHNYENTLPSGWGAMRNETFQISNDAQTEAQLRQKMEDEQAKLSYQPPLEQNPFRGRLPQAPMSMERRLRNPPSQFSFKKTPLSKQQDFMTQMRNAIQGGSTFMKAVREEETPPHTQSYDEDRADISPAKARTRGQLDLRQSTWQLPADSAAATGLEDLFGGNNFSLGNEVRVTPTTATRQNRNMIVLLKLVVGLVVPVVFGLALYYSQWFRRPFCLSGVTILEALGF
ncbi:Hypothetical protein R9X50_00110900 [Acrodontium crateriforme]|uniref:Ima1 N-terminal domain-containing protein n=1 Tax=Acrodontium crateriforme TaxID=150365 RepID=A0AAQ3R7L3_9PEZI|nr:Hypothetical protein R9X50_00110900 [Acrodontium crateriforme]